MCTKDRGEMLEKKGGGREREDEQEQREVEKIWMGSLLKEIAYQYGCFCLFDNNKNHQPFYYCPSDLGF